MVHNREYVSLIGSSQRLTDLREELGRIALSDAKVLITGESGSGKEVVAREIHARSRRASRPFVAINCAGIPETLLESELFGHVRGSFTGAFRDKPGKLEAADGGTMFLDEVGEMSPRMQGLLLRFLETGEIEKIGSERTTVIGNVRVISATNRNLSERITEGAFREDLYYRLNVINVAVPPLREHAGDIPQLVEHFMKRASRRENGQPQDTPADAPAISPETMAALMAYQWPGNVRELENVVERLLVVGRSSEIDIKRLPSHIPAAGVAPVTPQRERRRSIADDLFAKLVKGNDPFWTTVYPMYMQREIARKDMRDLVHRGLEEARGNYRIVLRLFNMEPKDYKRFLNFLRKHDCRLPFKTYRRAS